MSTHSNVNLDYLTDMGVMLLKVNVADQIIGRSFPEVMAKKEAYKGLSGRFGPMSNFLIFLLLQKGGGSGSIWSKPFTIFIKESMKHTSILALAGLMAFSIACSTTAKFNLPPGTTAHVTDRTVTPGPDGVWKTSPFFWSEAGGASYRLVDANGKVVRAGKLKTHFRAASIFWPPFALIYWPMGLHKAGYDLTKPADGYIVVDSIPASIAAPPEAAPVAAPAKKKSKK